MPVWPADPVDLPDDEVVASRRRPRWVAVVAIGLVVALIAAYGTQALIGDDDPVVAAPGPTLTPPDTTVDTTEPDPPTTEAPAGSTPPATDPPAGPNPPTELDAAVDELVDFVEQARESEFVSDPFVEFYDDEAFEERIVETFLDDEALELTDIEEKLYTALGLLEPGTSMLDLVIELLSSGVIGFYDPETAELAVRGTDLTPYVASTVVHELVHALDDQLHDLDKPEWDELTIDESNAVTSLVEGDARRIEGEWIATLSQSERADYAAGEAAAAGDADYEAFPRWLVDLLLAPYQLGEELLSQFDDEGEIDALFADPPESTEQVMDPTAFAADEQPVAVPIPEADGVVVDEGTLGALMLYLMVSDAVGPSEASTLASGWGGDAYVVYEDGNRVCVVVDVIGDSAGETASIASTLEAYAAASSAEASVQTVAGGSPRLTSCVDRP